ncbi:hypothetical protein [Streptomyces mexicanus]|uniref:hypothetical protein n=1 Tax=Streptomyces mexicanus TaxID=178566 RepID=UPI00364817AB
MTARDLRSQLSTASDRLRSTSPELSQAIDNVLAPYGWVPLKNSDPAVAGGKDTNLAMNMRADYRDAIVAAVDADPLVETVTEAVNEGFSQFLQGKFVLGARSAVRSGVPVARVNLNVRPSRLLQEQVRAAGASPAKVAAEYLLAKYRIGPFAEGATAPESLSAGRQRVPMVPRRVREEIRARAKELGCTVEDVVNEGFRKYLDGDLDLVEPVWSEQEAADMVQLKMYPDAGLYERVKAERGMRPLAVAIAYLLDEFGIEAGA